MDKKNNLYIPVPVPFWGMIEKDHIHINYHMNFIFHIDQNYVIAASIYPLRDQFQIIQPGATINFHGSVKFFQAHTY